MKAGEVLGLYVTMGEYDYVSVVEAPGDENIAVFRLGLGADGNVKTATLKAFTLGEFTALVNRLP